MARNTFEDRMRTVIREKVLASWPYAKRQSAQKFTALSPEVLEARAEFVARWTALTDEGLAAGYLEHAEQYDSPIEPVTNTKFFDGYEFLETEAEVEERIAKEVDSRVAEAMHQAITNLS